MDKVRQGSVSFDASLAIADYVLRHGESNGMSPRDYTFEGTLPQGDGRELTIVLGGCHVPEGLGRKKPTLDDVIGDNGALLSLRLKPVRGDQIGCVAVENLGRRANVRYAYETPNRIPSRFLILYGARGKFEPLNEEEFAFVRQGAAVSAPPLYGPTQRIISFYDELKRQVSSLLEAQKVLQAHKVA